MAIRRLLKNAAFAGARRLGVNACVRRRLRSRLLVLCYHGVIPDDHPEDPHRTRVATRVGDFRYQLATVLRLFTVVSANDLCEHLQESKPLPPYAALITFDDGFRNNLTYAAVEMERLGVPALIHVATGHVGRHELLWTQELDERILSWRHVSLPMPGGQADAELPDGSPERWRVANRVRAICKRLPQEERVAYLDRVRHEPLPPTEPWHRDLYSFLSWAEVRDLERRGFSIGSHTVSHPILTALSPSDLTFELRESKSKIENELGKPCPWFAYPNGGTADVSPEVVAAAETAGYVAAFTLTGHTNPSHLRPLEIDRTPISGQLSKDGFHAALNGFMALMK